MKTRGVWVLISFAAIALCGLVHWSGAQPSESDSHVPVPTELNPSEVIRTAYLALVRQSIVPVNREAVARAALSDGKFLRSETQYPLSVDFGENEEGDADWIEQRSSGLLSPWTAVKAMTRAANTAHMSLVSPQRREALFALATGKPRASPGFNLYPMADGRLVVFDIVEDGAAEASGLLVGDVLVKVDGYPALRMDPFMLNSTPVGTETTLDVESSGVAKQLVLTLIQSEASPVESRVLSSGYGYVFIRWFAHSEDPERDTASLVRRAFASLQAQAVPGLVIDLRSALGGIGEVDIASAICDGENIYWIEQPLSTSPRPVKRQGERVWSICPVVTLVNEHTVSAGEALVLALRELGEVKIVGKTTGGGLTEMSFVPLGDGYALSIPTGVVLGPVSGICPPHFAVAPDVEVENPTVAELIAGRDRQLEAALAILAESVAP